VATDVRQLPRWDQGLLASGVLVFIFSFFPYYGASYRGDSTSVTAWHGWAFVALLLLLAAAVVAAVQIFAGTDLPDLPVTWNVIVTALAAVGFIILVIRSFTLDSGNFLGVDYGLRWGAWLLMLAALAEVAFAVLRFRDSGEALPWQSRSDGDAAAPPPPAV
jgi:uncharacterized membrane protein